MSRHRPIVAAEQKAVNWRNRKAPYYTAEFDFVIEPAG